MVMRKLRRLVDHAIVPVMSLLAAGSAVLALLTIALE
jgi:hypothetical protein